MSEYFLNKFAEAELNGISQEKVADFLADVEAEGYDAEEFLLELGMEKAAEYLYELEKAAAKPSAFKTERDNYKGVAKAYGGGLKGWTKGIGAMYAEGARNAGGWVKRHPLGTAATAAGIGGAAYGGKKLYDYLKNKKKKSEKSASYAEDLVQLAKEKLYGE